ncbi:hypothetical protein F4825DRAFT_434493 [Nemania diffusa]|nr:hypothetical protein F4825DRAFT_434493 [Nemania diffusa]
MNQMFRSIIWVFSFASSIPLPFCPHITGFQTRSSSQICSWIDCYASPRIYRTSHAYLLTYIHIWKRYLRL